MKRTILIIALIFFVSPINDLYGQEDSYYQYPDSINKKRLRNTILIESSVYISGLSFLSFIWYKDQDRVPFQFYDDSKGYLQMDKAGHAYGAYWESTAAYYALRRAGMQKSKALLYGGPAGLIFQTPIEIFDGLYEGWGFSWSDMAANTAGAALFTAQEAWLDDQIVLMKFSYSPSIYADLHTALGESHIERFFLDYNAHTYWLSGNLKKITGIKSIPPWVNLAIGYSANGMIKEFENPTIYQGEPFPELDRYRQFLFSLDIDLSKVHSKKKWVRKLLRTANTIKIPFPAVEYNHIDGFSFKPMYF